MSNLNNKSHEDIDKSLFVLAKDNNFEVDRVEGKAKSFWADAFSQLVKKKISVLALIVILLLIIASIIIPILSPYQYNKQVLPELPITMVKQIPPRVPVIEKIGIFDGKQKVKVSEDELDGFDESQYEIISEKQTPLGTYYTVDINYYSRPELKDKYFLAGTDTIGRDFFTRIWYGARISLAVGFIAAIINMFIGVVYGGIAGYFGGSKLDTVLMRIAEILYSIPTLVWVTILSLVFTVGLQSILISLAITGWIGTAQLVRSQFLKLRGQEFVLASRTLGASDFRLIVKHLLPNIVGQIVVLLTVMIPSAIMYEAFLAFIGLGVQPPIPSIGTLIADGKTLITTFPRYIVYPSLVVSVLMLSIQLLSNGLRDALDPRMRNK